MVSLSFTKDKTKISNLEQRSAYVNAEDVNLRSNHTTNSRVIGKLNRGEYVSILDSYRPINSNEAILTSNVQFYNDNGRRYMLNKGKAVNVLEDYGNSYRISFRHNTYGVMTATVDKYYINFISGDYWYYIRKANGQTGWVLSKFVN